MYLQKKDLRSISLGYTWTPNMSYEDFCKKNDLAVRGDNSKGYDMYAKINKRYQNFLAENI